METIEAFSSERSEPIDELIYEWPASKFEKLYEAYAKRKVADDVSLKRSMEMAAIWGNSNLDEKGIASLKEHIDEVFSGAIRKLYGEEVEQHKMEKDIDWDDPWWRPLKRSMDKMKK